ncbi:MAG: DUF5309 domain-containing protein [Duncaniella sp.]|nr:DUF5309 domain-containing protein [Duncaniella sp.]
MATQLINNSPMGHPLTTDITAQVAPGLLRSAIDSRITKIRPSSTPLDQISRIAGGRHCGSMKVEYYAVALKKGASTVSAAFKGTDVSYGETFELQVKDVTTFAVSDTVILPAVKTSEGQPLSGYITAVGARSITVLPTNVGLSDEVDEAQVPAIPINTEVVRMGRAAGELDVQTTPYTTLPVKRNNYCQIFKSQVEEGLLQRLSDKEVGWTFSDQEEAAILDMRMTMERSFLFGTKTKITLNDGKDVMLTGGVWHQAAKEFHYSSSASAIKEDMISMMREAFSGTNGSPRKILLAGSSLIETLSRQDVQRTISDNHRVTKWGIDFDEIVSKFGTLYVVRSEVFDLCGMPEAGMVIDPEYITKYVHIPFSADRISFSKQGVRNTEGVVLTEASCLVLRYPEAHMRILPKQPAA